MREHRPVVPPAVSLPEITVKAVVLSVVLAAVLAAANAYLGLFAGMTVSASIPAAVASMAVLRCFRSSNILENNIVQTAASSGEALAAGIIFTIPGLLLIGYWRTFEYWQTTAIALVGGLLGVLFTIPLRRALIVDARLQFPEGVATAEVLKLGTAGRVAGEADPEAPERSIPGLRALVSGAALGAAVKLGEAGMHLWPEAWEGTARVGRSLVYGGINLSPALLAVGFIVGPNTAAVVFLGGIVGWLIVLPAYGAAVGLPEHADAVVAAQQLWSSRIRYVGIGAMLVGGLWTLTQLREPVQASLRRLHRANSTTVGTERRNAERTERDAPWPWIVVPFALSLVPTALLYAGVARNWPVAVLMTAVMAVAAFLFSSVAAYMAGLVGSSSNPVSGVTIATLMLSALLLLILLGPGHANGPAAALVIAAVVCCAAAMGGDNLQDLKTGHLVGATPWKQQIMQVVGVATAAFVLGPVLTVLQAKYGIGAATIEYPHPLSAPQATLMAGLAQSVFGIGLPWSLVGMGGIIGLLVIWLDRRQLARGAIFRVPVLAVALGIYLPFKLSASVMAGGILAALVQKRWSTRRAEAHRGGLLCAAGLITGEALMGIVLALPIAMSAVWPSIGSDPLAVFREPPLGSWPGLVIFAVVAGLLYRSAVAYRKETETEGTRRGG